MHMSPLTHIFTDVYTPPEMHTSTWKDTQTHLYMHDCLSTDTFVHMPTDALMSAGTHIPTGTCMNSTVALTHLHRHSWRCAFDHAGSCRHPHRHMQACQQWSCKQTHAYSLTHSSLAHACWHLYALSLAHRCPPIDNACSHMYAPQLIHYLHVHTLVNLHRTCTLACRMHTCKERESAHART